MTTKWLLIKFHDNFADEYDCESMFVMAESWWEAAKEGLRNSIHGSFDAGWGGNDENCYDSVEDYLSNFKTFEISESTAAELFQVLGSTSPLKGPKGWKWVIKAEIGVLPMPRNAYEWLDNASPQVEDPPCITHKIPIYQCKKCGTSEKKVAPYEPSPEYARIEKRNKR